jgi:hypothetical protein
MAGAGQALSLRSRNRWRAKGWIESFGFGRGRFHVTF